MWPVIATITETTNLIGRVWHLARRVWLASSSADMGGGGEEGGDIFGWIEDSKAYVTQVRCLVALALL